MSQKNGVDKLATDVVNASVAFESRLHGEGRFPGSKFKAFFEAVVRYATATADDTMIHREVAATVSGLREILELKSSRAPGQAIADADRMESILLTGHDPYFEGHEPPGC